MNPQVPQQPYAPPQPPQRPVVPIVVKSKWPVIGVVFIATTVLSLGVMTWALINFFDQKNTTDTRVSEAVAAAKKEQSEKDAAEYEAEKASATQLFAGPEDYGRVSFDYRKDWSLYIKSDASSGGIYEALFNPGGVPQVRNDGRYALRLTIENKDYDAVIDGYKNLVSRGDLKTSAVKVNENNGTRLDGNFTKDIRGSAVVFKIRDKTLTVRTDAETFKGDFDALIKTIKFNA